MFPTVRCGGGFVSSPATVLRQWNGVWRGLGAARCSGGAKGGVGAGRGGLEGHTRGGVELAGVAEEGAAVLGVPGARDRGCEGRNGRKRMRLCSCAR